MDKKRPIRHKVTDILNDEDIQAHSDLLFELDPDREFSPMDQLEMNIRFMTAFDQ